MSQPRRSDIKVGDRVRLKGQPDTGRIEKVYGRDYANLTDRDVLVEWDVSSWAHAPSQQRLEDLEVIG